MTVGEKNTILQKKDRAFSRGTWSKAARQPSDRQPLGNG